MKEVVVGVIQRTNSQQQQEYLLVSSTRDFGEYTGLYYPPGGHIECDESEGTALIREIKEELNLDINPKYKISSSPGDVKDQLTHWWFCSATNLDELCIDKNEIADVKWFTAKEIFESDQLWPATKKFFIEWLEIAAE